MSNLTDELEHIEFKAEQNFHFDLDREFQLISSNLSFKEKEFLKADFEFFLNKGKFIVKNTFGGGILFLKVPELIEKIKVEYQTNKKDFMASVVFESDMRKAENIKYKPEVGKTESIKWNTKTIFLNFHQYDREIQRALLTIIGKVIKWICEYGRINFAYMKIENEFEIELLINDQIESKLKVELN
jgi:hypothetical protein